MTFGARRVRFHFLCAAGALLLHAQVPVTLPLNRPIADRIAAGEARFYQVDIEAGQYIEAVVEPKGVDLVVRVIGPEGKSLLQVERPNGAEGPQFVFFIGQTAGPHRLEITAAQRSAKPGEYQVRLVRIGPPAEQDRLRAEAAQVYSRASQLKDKGDPDSQRQAREEFVHAAHLLERSAVLSSALSALTLAAGISETLHDFSTLVPLRTEIVELQRKGEDRKGEGKSLNDLAFAYWGLQQYDKAIECFAQTLPILRELNDRPGEGTELDLIATMYSLSDRSEKAIEYRNQTLAIRRELKDRKGESIALHDLASSYTRLKLYDKAIECFAAELPIRRELNDREGEGAALDRLGTVYLFAGRHEQAIAYLEQAIDIRRGLNDRKGEAESLSGLGLAHRHLNQDEKALEVLGRELLIRRELKDPRGEAGALDSMGHAQWSLDQYETAIELYRQELAIWRELKDTAGEWWTLQAIGVAYRDLSQYEKAIPYYEQSLPMIRELKDRRNEGRTFTQIADAYESLMQYDKAIGYYQRALAILHEMGDRYEEGTALNRIGHTYKSLGQYEKSIGFDERALALLREAKNKNGEGQTLAEIGSAYYNLGQYEKSIEFYRQAREIFREAKDKKGEGVALDYIGAAYRELRQYENGAASLELALAVEREAKFRTFEVVTLGNLGELYADLGQFEKAIGFHEQALAVARAARPRTSEGRALRHFAWTYRRAGQYEKAIPLYEQALTIARELKDRRMEAFTLDSLRATWQKLGRPRLAIFYGKEAVNVLQSIRADIQGLERSLQEGYVKDNENTYRQLAGLLIAQGRLPEAQQALNLLKQDEYLSFVRRDQAESAALSGRADLTSDEAEWAKHYREVSERLAALGARYQELLASTHHTPPQDDELDRIESDLRAGRQGFRQFLDGLNSHFSAKMASAGTSMRDLRDTEALEEDLGQLRHGAVAVYTLAGEEKYRAILVTPAVERAYEFPIKAADLNRKIQAFREALQDPNSDPRPLAQELYHILIVPALEADLQQAKAETLMWSLDGALRYLPLAALYDGKQYLIEKYRLAIFTPASQTRLKAEPRKSQWTLLGMGVTKAHQGFSALPNVADELGGIGRVVTGQALLDDAFTSTAMRAALRRGYPLVHIATHFSFQPGNESESFLLLGDGSHLSMAEMETSAKLFTGVELLTLSACNTGLGDSSGDGSEVEGFGVLAQRKGASAVVATLWSVADESTSVLMREFYRLLESDSGMLKSEALRQAQLILLHGSVNTQADTAVGRGVSVPQAASSSGFTHPYYWAPFFLMGNWL